jgi:ribonucleoside-diphosphate reductase beta chain
MTLVRKRNGSTQEWDPEKIIRVISLSASRSGESIHNLKEYPTLVKEALIGQELTVDSIHRQIENLLMKRNYFDTAREYITYRSAHMPDIFRPRANYRPYEYPQFIDYIDAIHQTFWTHRSFNLDSSVQDILVNMPKPHATAVIRSILSIASVEAKVKSFWSKLGERFPKAEFEELGATIGSNEVYHAHFYAKVLEQLDLNDLFKEVLTTPAMKGRIAYMNSALSGRNGTNEEYTKSLIFFSLFVENVSLFTQFMTVSVFNKELNQVMGLAQGISATALEENLHAQVGADLIQNIRKEQPHFFTPELNEEVYSMIRTAIDAELRIIDWIFEEGELSFLPKSVVIEYMYMRTNKGLTMAGFEPLYFDLDESLLSQSEWFEIQTKTTIHRDFFTGHNTNYTKNAISFSEDSLF